MHEFKQDFENKVFYSSFCNSGFVDKSSLNFSLSSKKLEVREYFFATLCKHPIKRTLRSYFSLALRAWSKPRPHSKDRNQHFKLKHMPLCSVEQGPKNMTDTPQSQKRENSTTGLDTGIYFTAI